MAQNSNQLRSAHEALGVNSYTLISLFFKKSGVKIENTESLFLFKRSAKSSLNVVINTTASTIFHCLLNLLLQIFRNSNNRQLHSPKLELVFSLYFIFSLKNSFCLNPREKIENTLNLTLKDERIFFTVVKLPKQAFS